MVQRTIILTVALILASTLITSADNPQTSDQSPSQTGTITEQLFQRVPSDFPGFDFANHPEQAKLLTHYLWYHFHHRLGNGPTLFNKEYLLTADIWLANAHPRNSNKTIQQVHRDNLLAIQISPEGYVLTHQHFSHAHDHGWPFPLWTQSETHPDGIKGKTAGWHFQPLDKVPGWVGDHLRRWRLEQYTGQAAISQWELQNLRSLGIKDNCWHLQPTGPSPAILTPKNYAIEAEQAPFLQLRWTCTPAPSPGATPYIQWLRENDQNFGPDRKMYFYPDKTPLSRRFFHSIIPVYRHPKWQGKIKRIRIVLAPGPTDATFQIDSFFTAYDTRHSINNPIFILASWRYFNWTGDLDFLRRNINRMRLALRYQQTVMGGLKYNHIRNPWPGHDGLPGFKRDPNGTITIIGGHGIGNNYWDLLPFGFDDLYATNQYYAATVAMAELEQAIEDHPQWDMPLGPLKLDPRQLRAHAQEVKQHANRLFWNDQTGRFVACFDKNGTSYDYGFTFLNLDAIWYDLADGPHARQIMDWLTGRRIIPGDTSTGPDIYRWRFGPRATTKRNIEWYGQGWYHPEAIPFGRQIQDGGAVLGFTFYDLWARLKILSADNCWKRLLEILEWEKEVHAAGGYRKYYKDPQHGNTLQGCGTPGGLGIDCEFFESSLLPSIIVYGFLGLDASTGDALAIRPQLPASCPQMSIRNLLYHNTVLDIRATKDTIELTVKQQPIEPLHIRLDGKWKLRQENRIAETFTLTQPATYIFERN